MTSSPAAVARVLDQLWEALGDGIASKGVIELIVKQALDAIQRETWEAAIEILLEEVSIARPKEKEMLACISRLRACAAASRGERDAR